LKAIELDEKIFSIAFIEKDSKIVAVGCYKIYIISRETGAITHSYSLNYELITG
jgi:hypothetical protein